MNRGSFIAVRNDELRAMYAALLALHRRNSDLVKTLGTMQDEPIWAKIRAADEEIAALWDSIRDAEQLSRNG
jgi:hypothetical protein